MKAAGPLATLLIFKNPIGSLTSHGQPRHILHRPGQREQKRKDQSDDAKNDRAGSVIRQRIHHNRERQKVTARGEKEE